MLVTASVRGVRDEDLTVPLAAAIDGDAEAFAVLWRSLHPLVLRYLRVVCGDAAEDVASETWLQVSRDMGRFDGTATAFRIWLFRIARHRGIDENRKAWRRHEEPHEAVDQLRVVATRDAATEVLELDDTDRALRLIAGLPRDQAEAVMLRVVAGLDVAGTARVLGKRPGAVRIAAMRGLRKLAEHPEVQAGRPATSAGPAGYVNGGRGSSNELPGQRERAHSADERRAG
nr:RNA polymerase sigma factor [Dactylosporangium thailandense]